MLHALETNSCTNKKRYQLKGKRCTASGLDVCLICFKMTLSERERERERDVLIVLLHFTTKSRLITCDACFQCPAQARTPSLGAEW
jgi:hypothetical protein